MKKTIITALIVVAGTATFASFAYQGSPGVKNPNPVDPVKHEAMQTALENKDYNAWKELMAGKGVLNRITTEAQFKKFVEMKALFESGDKEKAQKLQAELGLGQKRMDGKGMKKGMGQGKGIHTK